MNDVSQRRPPAERGPGAAQDLFLSAVRSHQAMDLAAAERLYRRVLASDPDHADCLHLLGILTAQSGRHDDAAALIGRAVDLRPDFAAAQYNLGGVLRVLGRNAAAVDAYQRAIAHQPDYAEAWVNLGGALHALGRHEAALDACRRTVALKPDYAEGHNNLGAALRALGRDAEALAAYRQAVALKPTFAEAHKNLGSVLRARGRGEAAMAATRQALALNPDFAEAWIDLAAAMHGEGRYEAAVDALRRALAVNPDSGEAYDNLGNALRELGRGDEALAAYRRSLRLDPERVDAYVNLAVALQEAGLAEEARTAVDQALALDPGCARAWRAHSRLKTFRPGDEDLAAMEALLVASSGPAMTRDDRLDLEFALGKAWMDAGDPDRAFVHLGAGNRRKRASFTYDVGADVERLGRIAETFSPALMARLTGSGDGSDLPVFVVGMPRSGTSLIEQILASHLDVHGAGELTVLADVVARALGAERAGQGFPGLAATLSKADLAVLGRTYAGHLAGLAPGKRRVVDKLPANFQFAGLIHLMAPNARIIHCRRDAVDTGLSIYSKTFTGRQDFAYDLGEIGLYHRGYEALMAHWRGVLPADRFIEVDYEDVVDGLEAQARRLIAFCGLDWDEACLEFHRTRRVVRTASANQVRQPLFRGSVGRWKPYARHLAPLIDALK